MKLKPGASSDPNDKIAALVLRLQETLQELQELTGGEIDSVLYPGGQTYLLRAAQEKLQKSDATQRQLAETMMAILNALPAHIALLDMQGVIIAVNNAWQQFGTSNLLQGPEFGVNLNYLKFCERITGEGAEEAHAAARGIHAVLKGEAKDFSLEYPCHSATEKRWFQLAVTPVRKDRLAGAVVMHVDITKRKQIEMRFRRLVDSNVQGVLFWTREGRVTGGNDSFLNLVGYTREEMEAGRINWQAMTPPEYAHLDRSCLEEIDAGGVGSPYEKEFIRKDGTRVPIFLGAASFEDNRDEGVCFILDLTDRKKLEQQFLRAQRMESIGTLAGGVAHDLNNILAPIMMSIDILKNIHDTPQTREILETIEVSAKRGADIVRQVLSFARGVEGERIEIQPKHLLKDLENIIKDTFPKDVHLQFVIPSGTWTVTGDPTQVHQILLNLCVNARDAMPNGGKLTIEVENCVFDEHYVAMNLQAKAGRYVKISVTDTGIGMPPAILNKIFEPFFTTKPVNKGTGLGLSTVMAIVKSHGGIVNVYSEPGKGTTFKVYLPATEIATHEQANAAPRVTMPRGSGETVLVVDDEDSILTITGKTLQAFGYRVLTATNGAEAVATYAQHKLEIAVVLTDMMMPVMDGPATIYALMKINPAVKIIAASGLTANGSGNPSPGGKVKHFLTKPYTAETLLTTLRAILEEA
jgi:PAS domain S-box-containing protein